MMNLHGPLGLSRFAFGLAVTMLPLLGETIPAFPSDPQQDEERTCFQTSQPWSPQGNLRSDVALVYHIGKDLPQRLASWRLRGYKVHVMTGVAWGDYQDFLYGKYDGVNHESDVQTDRDGKKIGHGGDVYYISPSVAYGTYLSDGIERALAAGAESIHLEEPEFWARAGYSEGFKREWKEHFGSHWIPPHESVDGQWKSSQLKYFLYRRALTQVFQRVQQWNQQHGKKVRCYVPTHSLLNYAHWCIVSPQSSLARIDGCDGYIAQVWTGTARTPNYFRGERAERTFETAFLEYAAMQNLVRSTGRRVWYLNDPIEDNPRHDWNDYQRNWESTLVASLLQPEVWHYEVAPWPERIFREKYPRDAPAEKQQLIPPHYATELQVVMNTLNHMKQSEVIWDAGTTGIGFLVSDSLMFQREQPTPSDPNMAHVYGQALPLLKRGVLVEPVQLENVEIEGILDRFSVLSLSYQGQKPLTREVHTALASWVKTGGALVVVDDDSDPYNHVKEWWNEQGKTTRIPRQHLFEECGLTDRTFSRDGMVVAVGKGSIQWLKKNPVQFSLSTQADDQWTAVIRSAAERAKLSWKEQNHIILRRGPYLIAAGLDASPAGSASRNIAGPWIDLLDHELGVVENYQLKPGNRALLLDLKKFPTTSLSLLASGCKALPLANQPATTAAWTIEGVGDTPGIALFRCARPPQKITLAETVITTSRYDAAQQLLWLKFPNTAAPRVLRLHFAAE